MKKIRAAIVGYGNIGRYVLDALQTAPDFEVAGVVRRDASNVPAELAGYPVVSELEALKDVQVAILCTPSRSAQAYAERALALGINTVDSFDIHTEIVSTRRADGGVCAEGADLYELRAGDEHGAHGGGQGDRGGQGGVVDDDSDGNGDSSPDGLYRGRRGA